MLKVFKFNPFMETLAKHLKLVDVSATNSCLHQGITDTGAHNAYYYINVGNTMGMSEYKIFYINIR